MNSLLLIFFLQIITSTKHFKGKWLAHFTRKSILISQPHYSKITVVKILLLIFDCIKLSPHSPSPPPTSNDPMGVAYHLFACSAGICRVATPHHTQTICPGVGVGGLISSTPPPSPHVVWRQFQSILKASLGIYPNEQIGLIEEFLVLRQKGIVIEDIDSQTSGGAVGIDYINELICLVQLGLLC